MATAGPFLVDATFRATNRLLNPEFDDDLSSWLLVHTVPNEILRISDDVHGLTASGAAALTVLDTDRQPVAVAQCVVFPAETDYLLRAQARIAVISGSDPIAFGSVEFFSSADCTGDPLDVELRSTVTGDTAGQWPLLELEALSAPGTASALVTFAAQGQRPASGVFTADVDHVFFGQAEVIFTDGFESGQTSAWSSTVP